MRKMKERKGGRRGGGWKRSRGKRSREGSRERIRKTG